MTSATAATPAWTATLTSPHTNPHLDVTIGSATLRLRVDLAAVIRRSRGPLLQAVAREAARLLRRHTGFAVEGTWARRRDQQDAFTVGIREIPGRCETCVSGCECRIGRDGCEHLGCRGVRSREVANSCPGAALLTAPARQLAAAANGNR